MNTAKVETAENACNSWRNIAGYHITYTTTKDNILPSSKYNLPLVNQHLGELN